MEENDIIIYENDLGSFNIPVKYPDVQKYFWDREHWNVEEAYRAFGPNMTTIYELDELEDFSGRIWAINSDDYSVAEAVEKELGGKVIEKAKFVTKYRDNKYTFCLLEAGE